VLKTFEAKIVTLQLNTNEFAKKRIDSAPEKERLTMTKRIQIRYMLGFLAAVTLLLLSQNALADQDQPRILGQIGDISVKEGELIDLSLKAPDGFGPDVKWTVSGLPEDAAFYEVPAFPGAEGFGAATTGGRGGRVVKVTNLNRDGPGSLKAALDLKEPRIIVFDVSGVIEGNSMPGEWLRYKSGRLYTANAPLTIAGQTAPGAGVTLNAMLSMYDGDGGTATDDAVLRFLRFRSPFFRGADGDLLRAGGNRLIFDHVSGAWGTDENFDFSNLRNATIQWSGIEEATGYGGPWEVFADADGDGMFDHWENKVRDFSTTDGIKDIALDIKANEDLDGDGVSNLDEYKNGTNPLVPGAPVDPEWIVNHDSDGDGLADWWEMLAVDKSATDDLVSLADIRPEDDLDGDLSTNREEYLAGTDPLAKPEHNFGMILGYQGKNISLHHNFFAHHKIRTPLSGVEVLDHRNNVIYNADLGVVWHPLTMNEQRPGERFKTNLVGNYFKSGPNSPKTLDIPTYFYPFIGGSDSMVYAGSNYFDMIDEPKGYLDIFDNNRRRGLFDGGVDQKVGEMFPVPGVQTHSAEMAYKLVLAHAGTLPRDAVTSRNVSEIGTRTGKWGKEMPANGLMEGLVPEDPPADSDGDGMPDEWETAVVMMPDGTMVNRATLLNPQDGSDYNRIVKSGESVLVFNGVAIDGTQDRYKGYTYIEYYINELADQLMLEQLSAAGYNETALPGYGLTPQPGLSWVPGYDQAGAYEVVITASDGIHSEHETIRITVGDNNLNPFIYAAMYDQDGHSLSTHLTNKIEAGRTSRIEFYVTEPDGQNYTINVGNLPVGATVIETGRQRSDLKGSATFDVYAFEWTPTLGDVGWTGTLDITATDSSGRTVTKNLVLQVLAPSVPLHTISATAAAGGSISPSGQIAVQEGDDKMFNITSQPGYIVSDIVVDGVSTGLHGVGAYLLENITSDNNIEVKFAEHSNSICGLIMKLDFSGNMQDATGLGNHGSASEDNAPQLTNDRFGNPDSAYIFDGINDYIRVTDSAYFKMADATLSAWVYGKEDFYKSQYIISKNGGDGLDGMGLFVCWDNLYTPGSGYPHVSGMADMENQWIHLAVVRKADTAEFYLNGNYMGAAQTGYLQENTLPLIIGARSHADLPSLSFFKGALDDLRIYNRALNASEIAVLAENQGVAIPDPGTDPGLDPEPEPEPEPEPDPEPGINFAPGDGNFDGIVDSVDLVAVLQALNSTVGDATWDTSLDLDGNGVIDAADLSLTVSNYGMDTYPDAGILRMITASAGPGGVILPESDVQVPDGGDRTFLICPEKGYAIEKILVDGIPATLTGESVYTFNKVAGDHTIEARFAPTPKLAEEMTMRLAFDGDFMDSSSWGNHGTASADSIPSFAADRYGQFGKAFYFDGVDDYVVVEDSSHFTSPEYTLAAWVYGMRDYSKAQYIVSKNHSESQNAIGVCAIWDSMLSCGAGYPRTGPVLKDMEQRWLHFSVVRGIWGVKFYLNGQYQETVPTGANEANLLNLIIGARSRTGADPNYAFFDGIIDDVRFYNRPLGAEEIQDLVLIPGDINRDGIVDGVDLSLLADAYGSSEGDENWNSFADFDHNGSIDMTDQVWTIWGFDVSRNGMQ